MTDQQIIHSLCCCNGESGGCKDCDMNGQENCCRHITHHLTGKHRSNHFSSADHSFQKLSKYFYPP